MSYNNYKKAMDLAKQCNYYYVGEGVTDEIIKKAQIKLDIIFSKQLYEYLKEYGYMSFYGNEFYGIIDENFSGDPESELVINALEDRRDYGLPLKWIPIYDFYDGTMVYLDYDNLNSYKEPRVILGVYNGDNYEVLEVLAEDFGDFVLQQVEEQLKNQ